MIVVRYPRSSGCTTRRANGNPRDATRSKRKPTTAVMGLSATAKCVHGGLSATACERTDRPLFEARSPSTEGTGSCRPHTPSNRVGRYDS